MGGLPIGSRNTKTPVGKGRRKEDAHRRPLPVAPRQPAWPPSPRKGAEKVFIRFVIQIAHTAKPAPLKEVKGRQKVPRELGEVECVRRVSIVVFPCGFAGKGRNNIQKHKCFCGEKCKVI